MRLREKKSFCSPVFHILNEACGKVVEYVSKNKLKLQEVTSYQINISKV
jgi:hypothetical protein